MQVKRFRVKGPVPQKTKTQVVPLNEHMVYENTPPKEVYPLLFSHNTWHTHRALNSSELCCASSLERFSSF